MAEELTFHFEGALADDHKMNFYEAARFQYAAARLLVKLAQFRMQGSFVKKITNSSNFNILLEAQESGSFNVRNNSPSPGQSEKKFVDLTLSDLLSYISERLIEKGDEGDLIDAIAAHQQLLAEFGGGDGDGDGAIDAEEADNIVEQIADLPSLKEGLRGDAREVVERRAAELARDRRLEAGRSEVSKIDAAREQKLIAMSAPLLGEMATALRRSANSLEVRARSGGKPSTILYLNKKIASEIETAKVDRDITPILCDITQYNKETGWGKVKFSNTTTAISFSIPSDINKRIQPVLIDQMKKDKVYLQSYFVRDRAGEPIRLIVVGILPTPID